MSNANLKELGQSRNVFSICQRQSILRSLVLLPHGSRRPDYRLDLNTIVLPQTK